MTLLDKLWDDTVAGPRPENGLSKLRKFSSANSRQGFGKEVERESEFGDDPLKVTRSIMIVKSAGSASSVSGSPPPSPAGSTPPLSPFFGASRFLRKSSSDANERMDETRSRVPPPPYDM